MTPHEAGRLDPRAPCLTRIHGRLAHKFRAASMVSFLSFERVLRNIDRADNVSVGVEAALANVLSILRLVLPSAGGAPLRRFVRIDVDQTNARQRRLVLNEFRESVKTPRVERTIVLFACCDLLFREFPLLPPLFLRQRFRLRKEVELNRFSSVRRRLRHVFRVLGDRIHL